MCLFVCVCVFERVLVRMDLRLCASLGWVGGWVSLGGQVGGWVWVGVGGCVRARVCMCTLLPMLSSRPLALDLGR